MFCLVRACGNANFLLQKLVAIPSYSREEFLASDYLERYLMHRGVDVERYENNLVAYNLAYDETKPTILLNSHIDTVRPAASYSRDPHAADIEDGKLYGLGSNDAGASLVSLVQVFLELHQREEMKYNVALAISAQEEVSGVDGMELLVKHLRPIDFAIVGEPTSGQMAVSERGLMVVDLLWSGVSGHAARGEGVNAIYKAVDDIVWMRDYCFEKVSPTLGATTMNFTMINSGTQHNVVPDNCKGVLDIRISDAYSFEEILDILRENMSCQVQPRSQRLRPSSIDMQHPIVEAAKSLGIETFGSMTLSDQALMPFDSVKIGPGDSSRSHTSDEFIYLSQIEKGIETYMKLVESII